MSCYYDDFQHPIGSIVTRLGTDRWCVFGSNATETEVADLVYVECIRAPDGENPWCKPGDYAEATPDRYRLISSPAP
ncbi:MULTISPECIES: hypothetical protein [unclassified Bradyrhizobium]|uniref:hypothetical protein n=1 Tax=unclassified Bradyrhizobium TaxID=2631580 RepID=UPI002FF26BE3